MLPIKCCIPLFCLISTNLISTNVYAQTFGEHIDPYIPHNAQPAAARDEAYPYSPLPTEVYPSSQICPYYQSYRCPSPFPPCPGPATAYANASGEIYPYNPKTQSYHTYRYTHVSDEGYSSGSGYSSGGCSSCRGHD